MWTAQRNPITCLVEGYHEVSKCADDDVLLSLQSQSKHGPCFFKDMSQCPEDFYDVSKVDVDDVTGFTAPVLFESEVLSFLTDRLITLANKELKELVLEHNKRICSSLLSAGENAIRQVVEPIYQSQCVGCDVRYEANRFCSPCDICEGTIYIYI